MNDQSERDLESGARLFIYICLAGVLVLLFLIAWIAGAFR